MYSHQLRVDAVKALTSVGGGFRRVAKIFQVSPSTLCRWNKEYENGGVRALFPEKRYHRGNTFLIRSKIVIDSIKELVRDNPFTTQAKLREKIWRTLSFKPSCKLIGAVLKENKLDRVKCRLRMSSLKSGPPTDADFRKFSTLWGAGKCVAIDETGFGNQYAPCTGYTQIGTRLFIPSGSRSRKWFTAIAAILSQSRPVVFKIQNGGAKSVDFAEFIKNLPYEPGTTLVMDNASIHKTYLSTFVEHMDVLRKEFLENDERAKIKMEWYRGRKRAVEQVVMSVFRRAMESGSRKVLVGFGSAKMKSHGHGSQDTSVPVVEIKKALRRGFNKHGIEGYVQDVWEFRTTKTCYRCKNEMEIVYLQDDDGAFKRDDRDMKIEDRDFRRCTHCVCREERPKLRNRDFNAAINIMLAFKAALAGEERPQHLRPQRKRPVNSKKIARVAKKQRGSNS